MAIHAQNSSVSEECLNLHRQFWRNVSGNCYIGNIFNATSPGGVGVFVNSDGKLGTSVSSRRFKDDIKPMDKISEAILSLQLVTFHYKKELDIHRDGIEHNFVVTRNQRRPGQWNRMKGNNL